MLIGKIGFWHGRGRGFERGPNYLRAITRILVKTRMHYVSLNTSLETFNTKIAYPQKLHKAVD